MTECRSIIRDFRQEQASDGEGEQTKTSFSSSSRLTVELTIPALAYPGWAASYDAAIVIIDMYICICYVYVSK